MLSDQIILPEELQLQLRTIPETGMGYHIVDIIMNNGSTLKNRTVINSSILLLHPDESIDVGEIETIATSVD